MDQGETRTLVESINSRLQAVDSWDRFAHRHRAEAWVLTNALVFCLNGEDIQFLDACVISIDNAEVEGIAFSARHLVRFQGVPSEQVYAVLDRRSLTGLEVLSPPSVIPVNGVEGLENSGRYKLAYGDQASFSLPLAASSPFSGQLTDLFPSLLQDLLS